MPSATPCGNRPSAIRYPLSAISYPLSAIRYQLSAISYQPEEEDTMATGLEIAQRAKEQLAQLTGLKPDTVSSLSRDNETWHVSVVMIELKRIPESEDVLATYEVVLDDAGNMISYRRTRRYYRGQVAMQEA
jgi:hypothetical protein